MVMGDVEMMARVGGGCVVWGGEGGWEGGWENRERKEGEERGGNCGEWKGGFWLEMKLGGKGGE